MDKKLLTIVLPTYNRKHYLIQTLALFESQVLRNSEEVRLVISNNASGDGTIEAIEAIHKESPFFDYVNFQDHVDIGISITRSNDLAETEFVMMWGDDDYPFPYIVDVLLATIKAHPEASLIHFNRLHGRDAINGMTNIAMQNNVIGDGKEHTITVKECVDKYILDMSFLTTNVFRRSYWVQNKDLDTSKHYGYEFLGRMLHGMEEETAVYIEFPMCIQRMPATRSWTEKSPQFRFIGIPNMYKDFEEWGLTDNAKELWMKQGNTSIQFLALISQAALYKKYNRPLFREICSHQYSFARKIIVFFFIFLCPAWMYRLIRKIKYKS